MLSFTLFIFTISQSRRLLLCAHISDITVTIVEILPNQLFIAVHWNIVVLLICLVVMAHFLLFFCNLLACHLIVVVLEACVDHIIGH